MPEKLEIGFFVFGAVLMLIGLVGGKFKIFVTNMPDVSNPFLRVVAFVLGVVFVMLSLGLALVSNVQAEAADLPAAAATATPAAPALPELLPTVQPTQPALVVFVAPSVTPQPARPDPLEFAGAYWQNVSNANLEQAWEQLSPRFRQANHNDDYTDYVRGYQNMQLCRVEMSNPSLVRQDTASAVLTAHFDYYAGSQCALSEYDFEMRLVFDPQANTWLFDRNSLRQ